MQALRAATHDAVHLREESLIRLPDPDIVAKAVHEQRVVLTFDLDFGDILAVAGIGAPSVIIFRLRNQTPAAVNPSGSYRARSTMMMLLPLRSYCVSRRCCPSRDTAKPGMVASNAMGSVARC